MSFLRRLLRIFWIANKSSETDLGEAHAKRSLIIKLENVEQILQTVMRKERNWNLS